MGIKHRAESYQNIKIFEKTDIYYRLNDLLMKNKWVLYLKSCLLKIKIILI